MLRDVSRVPLRTYVWTAWVVAALLMLPNGNELAFTAIIGVSALIIAALPGMLHRRARQAPLLAPLGSFYANVKAGEIELPWASIAGFMDVLGLMVLVMWLAHRRERRRRMTQPPKRTPPRDTGRGTGTLTEHACARGNIMDIPTPEAGR